MLYHIAVEFHGCPKIIRDAELLAGVKFQFLLWPILNKIFGGDFSKLQVKQRV
jgi:hypothetical protein